MEGDFSLNALFSRPGVTRVLLQQGRVLLPSDWNEQVAVSTNRLRELARDLIGPHAGPSGNAGFKITFHAANNQFRIGKGRYWVEGFLVENDRERPVTEQPYYHAGDLKLDGSVLFYLDVREQHVSAVQDPSIREIALGGPDTATRAVVVWQVRALELGSAPKPEEAWQQLQARLARKKVPLLVAEAKRDRDDEACIISPDSRYTGPENQLYRVEIHSAATAQGAPPKFKWSRDNGSISFAASKIEGLTATLLSLGRDRRTSLAVGDFVEAGNDVTRFNDEVRPLVVVKKIDPSTLDVTLAADPGLVTDPKDKRHPFLRRWDSPLIDVPKNGVPVPLEKGIEVTFTQNDADYRPGDYWLIPARTVSGDVIWPPDENGKPKAVEPHGPARAYAPLAHRNTATGVLTELRFELNPQTHLKTAT